MKIRRFILVFIACVSFITFFVVPVSAEETSLLLDVRDFDYSCIGVEGESGSLLPVKFEDVTYSGIPMRKYSCSTSDIVKAFFVSGDLNLHSGHEYSLEFQYSSLYSPSTSLVVNLLYYNGAGELIKTQGVDVLYDIGSGVQTYSSSFRPDLSDISSSFTVKLQIILQTYSTSPCSWYLSQDIVLTDKDDSSGLLLEILSAILQLDSDIDTYLSDLESSLLNQLISLDSNIDSYFDELGGELVSAIANLDNNIGGYFELLKNGIIENDNALSDKLHEYLDKYKPRLYEDIHWVRGSYVNGVLSTNGNYAVCTDKFYISPGTNYVFEYNEEDNNFSDIVRIILSIYDSNGEFLSERSFVIAGSFELNPEPGYCYTISVVFENSLAGMSSHIINRNLSVFLHLYADEGWLTAFGNYIINGFNNILNPGVYEDPGTDAFHDVKDGWEYTESQLPTFDESNIHDVDISNYAGGFGAVRYLFDRFVAVSGLETLLAFSLMFGLGVFLLGRKVGG